MRGGRGGWTGLAERHEARGTSATVEPGCGAAGLSHPSHAPWRSAFGDFGLRTALIGPKRFRMGGFRRQCPSAGRRVVAIAIVNSRPFPASSSHRDRSVPRAVPEASREQGVTPARRRRPSPNLQHTSGRPPRLGDGRGQDRAGEEGGDKFGGQNYPMAIALVAIMRAATAQNLVHLINAESVPNDLRRY